MPRRCPVPTYLATQLEALALLPTRSGGTLPIRACLGPGRLQQKHDAESTWLACVLDGHLSSRIMSPHRRVKQNSPKSRVVVFPIPNLLFLPAYRPAPRRPQHNRRPSDRLPKQRSMKLRCW